MIAMGEIDVDPGKLSRQARYARKEAEESKDIGELPPVTDPALREAVLADPVLFMSTCFPMSTSKHPLSDDHHRMLARMESCARHGGKFVNLVYRSFGKTSHAIGIGIWSLIKGLRRFVALIGANRDKGDELIGAMQQELSGNQILLDLFPEVFYPIWRLDGSHHKAAHQLYHGEKTHIKWSKKIIILPTIPGSKASGGIIFCGSMKSSNRGTTIAQPDGTRARPDFVLVDDPQTDQSAASPAQVAKNLRLFNSTLANLGSHFTEMAMVVNGTPIVPGDAVEVLSDPKQSPSWQSERFPMLRTHSVNKEMWLNEYAEIRNSHNPEVIGDQRRAWNDATAFYAEHREEMDKGATVSWEWCYKDHEISAIQHAYNMLIDLGEESWMRECQLQPIDPIKRDSGQPTAREIAARVNGLARRQIDDNATDVTAFIDVQESSLWFVACWWHRGSFAGGVLDYGAWPDQPTKYYTLSSLCSSGRTLQQKYPRGGLESQWMKALGELTDVLLGREYQSPSGSLLRITRCGIDANYGKSTSTVKAFCRSSKWASVLVPYHGKFVGATSTPFDQYQKRPGEIVGPGWRYVKPVDGGARHCNADTNAWKSSVLARLKTPIGDGGALALFGVDGQDHRMFADHMVSEHPVRVAAKGREVDEWKERPDRPDNHFWDCITGAMVMASMNGVSLGGSFSSGVNSRKKCPIPSHLRR